MSEPLVLTLDGSRIRDIASFHEEIERVLMPDEDWRFGGNLDALDDLLYGGYGRMKGAEQVRIIWRDFEASRKALGLLATRGWILAKLDQPEIFNQSRARADLAALDAGTGPTYFETVIDIFADHPQIEILPD